MTAFVSLIVDGVLAVLLLAAIIACWVVYNRLATIRQGQDELKALVDNLNAAIVEAQRSVAGLKSSSTEVEQTLHAEVVKGKALSDELSVIIEAGNNLADRIEKGLTDRGDGQPKAVPLDPPERNREQKALLEALKEAR